MAPMIVERDMPIMGRKKDKRKEESDDEDE